MSRDSIRRAVSWSVAASCFLLAVVSSFADSISYTYDDLNRLTKTQYGSGTVIEYTYDEVGNRLQKKITDTTAPTGTIVINAGAAATNVTAASLTLTCSDTNGCSQMQLSNDNITWNAAEAYVASKAWPLTAGAGTKIVYSKFKDSALL